MHSPVKKKAIGTCSKSRHANTRIYRSQAPAFSNNMFKEAKTACKTAGLDNRTKQQLQTISLARSFLRTLRAHAATRTHVRMVSKTNLLSPIRSVPRHFPPCFFHRLDNVDRRDSVDDACQETATHESTKRKGSILKTRKRNTVIPELIPTRITRNGLFSGGHREQAHTKAAQ